MKKIGIATVFTGFNYGSSLQAFATKYFIESMGFEAVLLGQSGSIIPGRDVRIKKIIMMGIRFIIYPNARKNIKVYRESPAAIPTDQTKKLFNNFVKEFIKPKMKKWGELKSLALNDEYIAFLCGSDQIWNADALYVDPFYYLQFAPIYKRIAFSPSFGREKVASYNKKVITKYIKSIPTLSVREESGVILIRELTNRQSEHLLDPTLMLSKNEWNDALKIRKNDDKYILAYFLNTPTIKAIKTIKSISKKTGSRIIALPKRENKEDWFNESKESGPKEFVELIANATFVCTDSFHGTAFAINYNIPFFVFDRQYGTATKQSARIESLLKLVDMELRFNPEEDNLNELDFTFANDVLNDERKKVKEYLKKSIEKRNDIF